ncbi:cytochrome C oxidase subunit II [Gordoniibacillus kamchatkensis]|uniref:Cytochrome aa3 subunit 2 n=1 Tax=Gordoniibacillus kamchatkensis TaxID=1590651 RepID=A0ABR5AJ53_9BACL|nr:cytochrome c oxidase subunit II [Paenibacillus sp. VKM B-2647]KIL40942.1 cytochrome C oxidase subunit II [Paenibacillus sp. VKM B-2647]
MHIHRLEKIWIGFGLAMLLIFLLLTGVAAFAMGISPPSSSSHENMHHGKVDPTKLQTTAPFDKPGLKQIGDNEYEAVLIAYAFGYNPDTIDIPHGAKVHFIVTSSDVVHGFEIPGTNVNFMAEPGEVTELTHTFDKAGQFLVLCNEYCGTGHEMMKMTINVK